MFGNKIQLFKLFGFQVSIDLSWFIILLLIIWSLATAYFPQTYPGMSETDYWTMGSIGAIGLFLSIVLHELSHSLVARRYGLQMKGITLFIFGGVAEMPEEPQGAGVEFKMAIAGPLASLAIAAICWGISRIGALPTAGREVIFYLAWINAVLAIFNMVPAFPLDGGRGLRAAIWQYTKNMRKATRISSRIGVGFGYLLIALGAFSFIGGNFIGGMWWFLIGMFLSGAARASYQQLVVRQALEGEPVRRFMKTDVVGVPPEISLREFVEEYLYRHFFKFYPVLENGRLTGCITMSQVKAVPRDEWPNRTVHDLMTSCSRDNTIGLDEDVVKALEKMSRSNLSRLLVVEGERLAGVITLKDLLDFMSLKMEMEDQLPAPDRALTGPTIATGDHPMPPAHGVHQ